MSKEKTILITNDDGYEADGLKALIELMRRYGQVVVVAPEVSQSGQSHAITIKYPVRLKQLMAEPDFAMYVCTGTPVDCVKIALDKILGKKPDLLLSGINHGSNSSISAIYSGTIAAAMEGCINDIDSMGFSVTCLSANADMTAAKKYVQQIIDTYMEKGMPKGCCLNVNVPYLPAEKIAGIKMCRQAKGMWVEEFEKRTDPSHKDYYWLTGNFLNHENDAEDTDEWALKNGYVSVVPLHPDLTHYKALREMKKWL